MDFINSNPYRILGVLSNSSRKEIVANYSKIKAYLKTGKQLSFENDFNGNLKPVVRRRDIVRQQCSNIDAETSFSKPMPEYRIKELIN